MVRIGRRLCDSTGSVSMFPLQEYAIKNVNWMANEFTFEWIVSELHSVVRSLIVSQPQVPRFEDVPPGIFQSPSVKSPFLGEPNWTIVINAHFVQTRVMPPYMGHMPFVDIEFVSLYLRADKPVQATYHVYQINSRGETVASSTAVDQYFDGSDRGWGRPEFAPRRMCLNNLCDGALKIMAVIRTERQLSSLQRIAMSRLASLRSSIDSDDCDFTIRIAIDNKRIKVHKSILTRTWPYFQALLETGMTEAQAGELTIRDYDYTTVKAMIEHLYSGVFEVQSVDTAIKLLEAAQQYQVDDLKNVCIEFLGENLTEKSVFTVLMAASKLDIPALKEAAYQYIVAEKQKNPQKKLEDFDFDIDAFMRLEPLTVFELMNTVFSKIK